MAGRASYLMATRNTAASERAFEQLGVAVSGNAERALRLRRIPAAGTGREGDRGVPARARASNPAIPWSLMQMAFEYLKQGDHSSALPLARQAVAAAPTAFPARKALGQALLDSGDIEGAIQASCRSGLKLAPDSPGLHFTHCPGVSARRAPGRCRAAARGVHQARSPRADAAQRRAVGGRAYREVDGGSGLGARGSEASYHPCRSQQHPAGGRRFAQRRRPREPAAAGPRPAIRNADRACESTMKHKNISSPVACAALLLLSRAAARRRSLSSALLGTSEGRRHRRPRRRGRPRPAGAAGARSTQADFEVLEDGVTADDRDRSRPSWKARWRQRRLPPYRRPSHRLRPAPSAPTDARLRPARRSPPWCSTAWVPRAASSAVQAARVYLGQKEEMQNYVGLFSIDLSLSPIAAFHPERVLRAPGARPGSRRAAPPASTLQNNGSN